MKEAEINATPSGMTLGRRCIAVPRLQLQIANKHVSPSMAAMEKHAAPARPANLTAQSATLGLVPPSHDPRLRLGALHLKLTPKRPRRSPAPFPPARRSSLTCPPLRLRPAPLSLYANASPPTAAATVSTAQPARDRFANSAGLLTSHGECQKCRLQSQQADAILPDIGRRLRGPS